ncbi:DUF6415 family natural product biosynthesis protein [Streptomyces sp. NPDC015492]|uniref:DUF6415 family natural product biosynthesis protein n=1 Tax=Streptomyces sp. NPDC015492 TaxID=3364958 RepID=UPI0036F6535F
MTYGSVVHDPTGCLSADIPLDRDVHERLAATVLGWRRGDTTAPPTADIEQAALQLTGYIHLLIREVQTRTAALPRDGLASTVSARTLAKIAADEAVRRLRGPLGSGQHALPAARSRARLVQALHRALDRTLAATPMPPEPY